MKNFSHLFIIVTLLLSATITSCENEITYCKVTYDANGGLIDGDSVITVAKGDHLPPALNFKLTYPEKHRLTGWYRDAESTDLWNIDTDVVSGDMTLYAGWERRYSVTFHGNGGIFRVNDGKTFTINGWQEGEYLHIRYDVIKPGFVLEGWYRDAELTDLWDFDTDFVSGDIDLYAKWGAGIEGLTLENYPQVDGATSTRALNMMIACKLLGLPYTWDEVADTQEMTVWPLNNDGRVDELLLEEHIKTSQTYGAMINLIEGKADIILRSTTASPEEKAVAEAAGVTLIETPIALDAFVFIKNKANPLQSLTIEQIRKIYTKQIANWSQVSGDNATIKALTRPRNSGSEEAFRELVMNGEEPAEFPEEQQISSMVGVFREMEREKYGICYIFKNYSERIYRQDATTSFAINGIFPTLTTMRDGTYPLTTEVYAIIRSDLDRGSMAFKLYEWLQTETMKLVLEECGFASNL
jgi:phosphate transport system substrate-binding protein